MTSCMSYGWFGLRGHDRVERLGLAVGRVAGRRRAAASSRLFDGRKPSRSRMSDRHSRSSAAAKCATPLLALCVIAPPSSSLVTSSWVTVLMTSGPVTNM